MNCPKCGTELSEGVKFCSNCGGKIIEETKDINIDLEESVTSENTPSDSMETDNNTSKPTLTEKLKKKIIEAWSKLSKFSKLMTISIALCILLCLIAFLFGKIFAGIITIIQITLFVFAWLMKKQVIKTPQKWLHILLPIIALLLIVPYVSLFNINPGNAEKFNWSDIALSNILPEPKSNSGEIYGNSDTYLSIDVYKTSEAQYNDYVDACKEKGLIVESEQLDNSYYAYNQDGYELDLYYYESDKMMHISVDAPKEMDTIQWPDNEMAKLIPAPKSTVGRIEKDNETGFVAYIGETPIADYNEYINTCSENGFNIDSETNEKYYRAKNSDGYKLTVEYKGNSVIYISVAEPEYDINIKVTSVENWIFSKYDVEVYIDDLSEGTLTHGTEDTYTATLKKGTHTIKFVSTEDDSVDGEVEFEVSANATLEYKISYTSSAINIEMVSGGSTTNNSEESTDSTETSGTVITMPMDDDDYVGRNYLDVEKELKELGLTNFVYRELETDDEDKTDGEICSVSVKDWTFSKGEFSKGDTFEPDCEVEIYYYVKETEPGKLTIENCPELAAMLSNKAEIDPSYSSFAIKYKGQLIEFDGRVDYVVNYKDYDTRYEMLVSAGDYNPDSQIGPTFKFKDINYLDLGLTFDDSNLKTLFGKNVHIVAEVESFDSNTGLFYLEPVSVTVR